MLKSNKNVKEKKSLTNQREETFFSTNKIKGEQIQI